MNGNAIALPCQLSSNSFALNGAKSTGVAVVDERPSGLGLKQGNKFKLKASNTLNRIIVASGEVDERFKSHAWKACVGLNLPRVRIPPSPPVSLSPHCEGFFICPREISDSCISGQV